MDEHNQRHTRNGNQNPNIPDELKNKSIEYESSDVDEDNVEDTTSYSLRCQSEDLPSFIDNVHTYVREFIVFADQKAAFVFAASTAMLVFIYEKGALDLWCISPLTWSFTSIIALIASIMLLLGIIFPLIAVWPRLGGSLSGIVYWNAIKNYGSPQNYITHIRSLSSDDLLSEMSSHLFELSNICEKKYKWISFSIWSISVGFIASIILIISNAI